MVECASCKGQFADDKSLHGHLKAHKLHVFEYYQKHYPRYDKQDGTMIAFKNKKQYFESDFNSVKNACVWLNLQNEQTRKNYLQKLLLRRQKEKNLTNTLSQVELRSLKIPGINFMNKVFGNYYSYCETLGFKSKYKLLEKLDKKDIFANPSAKILIDSREQLPLSFAHASEVVGLKFGDYAFSCDQGGGECHIERKSLSDFIGTLSGGYERFEREIIRAKEAGSYLIILVEENLNNAIKFNLLDEVYKKGMKITPEYVFHNVRELIQKYDCIQFLFVKDRGEASKTIENLFCYGRQVMSVDLQYCHDMGIL